MATRIQGAISDRVLKGSIGEEAFDIFNPPDYKEDHLKAAYSRTREIIIGRCVQGLEPGDYYINDKKYIMNLNTVKELIKRCVYKGVPDKVFMEVIKKK